MQFIVSGLKYDVQNRIITTPQAFLAKGFFCLPIRISCFIISAVSLITSFILMCGLFTTLFVNNSNKFDKNVVDELTWKVMLLVCADGLDIIASILLLMGSLTKKRSLIIPYVTFNFVLVFLGFFGVGLGRYNSTTTWNDTGISIAVQGVSIYVWMIVVSYYQLLASSSVVAEKLVG